jgi:toxin HigB-1
VKIRSIAHKGVRRLYEEDSSKGLSAEAVDKLRKMLAFLDAMQQDPEELRALATWRVHILTGDCRGTWSLHVIRSWRLTFRIEVDEIIDVNLEDDH